MEKEKGLYLHIPFCERKCHYCGFLSFPATPKQRQDYVRLLIRELELEAELNGPEKIDTIFMGGGTPSLLTGSQVDQILDAVDRCFTLSGQAEVTMEGNPNSLSREKLSDYRRASVNRLSIGIQSFDEDLLQKIGRLHDRKQNIQCYEDARRAGFENINLDLIFALPEQTQSLWQETLDIAGQLDPEHLAFYSLQLEENTPFYRAYGQGQIDLAGEEKERAFYQQAREHLENNHYLHYEISNGAKRGFCSRHNLKYWNMEEFLGMGLGASFFYRGYRGKKIADFSKWQEALKKGVLPIDAQATQKETREEARSIYCFTALRTREGIRFPRYQELFGTEFLRDYDSVMEELRDYEKTGNLTIGASSIALTPKGIGQSNDIMACFV